MAKTLSFYHCGCQELVTMVYSRITNSVHIVIAVGKICPAGWPLGPLQVKGVWEEGK